MMPNRSLHQLFSRNQSKRTSKAGFTLIELLVVTGITAIVMITVSTMFMTFILSSARTNARRVIQAEGNSAINRIEFVIRNASDVNSTCSKAGVLSDTFDLKTTENPNLVIKKDADGDIVVDGKKVTSETITVIGPSFVCKEGATGTKNVMISFTLNINDNQNNELSQDFKSTVQVRNTGF